jgi:sugar lactone lactonase YvrE
MERLPVTCLVDAKDSLGEGCCWDAGAGVVWWLDIARPSRIHRLHPATGEHRVWYSSLLLTALALRNSDGLILGGEDGVYDFDPATGAITPFAKPEDDRPQNRFNDGACDPQGRLWIGTMHQNIGPMGEDLPIPADTGALFRVDGKGRSQRFEDHVGVSNGPCWSPDGQTFYFSDSKNSVIYAYDFEASLGGISNRRVLNDTKDHGYPDGATVDAEGFIWSARWDGGCVLRIDPKGRLDRVIAMPAQRPTCVCFGGANLDVMYVTSSRAHLAAESLARHPLQGGLFCFNPGVKGTPKHHFAGREAQP